MGRGGGGGERASGAQRGDGRRAGYGIRGGHHGECSGGRGRAGKGVPEAGVAGAGAEGDVARPPPLLEGLEHGGLIRHLGDGLGDRDSRRRPAFHRAHSQLTLKTTSQHLMFIQVNTQLRNHTCIV